ncbi:MAG TPA: shikimate dehydrogenase [Xanthomonadaceae bacterium]|nr:shikimate dehydrogenase [Xanthomonadaceae bacterium]
MSDRPAQFALFGQPVAHSLSPRIHATFARQQGVAMEYRTHAVAEGAFAHALAGFHRDGGRGANITLPHKQAAVAHCSSLSAAARRADAVNTLVRHQDGWHGENTDGSGLVRDLADRHGLDLRGRRTLLLGAGGAARGVLPALLDAGVGEVTIVNRSPARADALVDAIGEPGRVHARYVQDLDALGEFDLVVNATSAGREGNGPGIRLGVFAPRSAMVDLNYGLAAIQCLALARAAGARAIDGLGMLVEQAADSFALWHGRRPETDAVYQVLRLDRPADASAD